MLKFKTKTGIEFNALPDTAYCKKAKKHPNSIDNCPCKNFDDGVYCVPELCEFYTNLLTNDLGN